MSASKSRCRHIKGNKKPLVFHSPGSNEQVHLFMNRHFPSIVWICFRRSPQILEERTRQFPDFKKTFNWKLTRWSHCLDNCCYIDICRIFNSPGQPATFLYRTQQEQHKVYYEARIDNNGMLEKHEPVHILDSLGAGFHRKQTWGTQPSGKKYGYGLKVSTNKNQKFFTASYPRFPIAQ